MSEFNYDPVENILQHVFIEERQQKRIEELEAALKEAQDYVHFCIARNGPNASPGSIALRHRIRDLLEKRGSDETA